MIRTILGSSRYFIFIAILAAFLAALLLSVYAGCLLLYTIFLTITHATLDMRTARQLALECIELVDFFLLSTAFYLFAAGLYELFIDSKTVLPVGLRVYSLEELKAKLLGVIIVVMSVFFLEQVINWNNQSQILNLGISEALIIGVLVFAIKQQKTLPHTREDAGSE